MINQLLANYPMTTQQGSRRALDMTMTDDTLTILVVCSVQFWLNNSDYFKIYSNQSKYILLIGSLFAVEYLRNFFNFRTKTKKQVKKNHQEQDGLYHHEVANSPY